MFTISILFYAQNINDLLRKKIIFDILFISIDKKDSLEKKRKVYKEYYLQEPIVMRYWFLKSFQDPQSW